MTYIATALPTMEGSAEITAPAIMAGNPLAFLTDTAAFNHLWRIATGYARSQLVPMQFRGKPDDCFIACQLAIRLKVDPFMLLQSMYVVHGRPGFEAKLAIALLNASGKIRGTIKTTFEGTGDGYGARAWAVDAHTGEKVAGPRVDWKMVKAEGWNKDKPLRDGNGVQKSKWNTMPDLMFVYRAASFFIRSNYPEVLMGMSTTDEIEDSILDVSAFESLRDVVGSAEPPKIDAPVFESGTPDDESPEATTGDELSGEAADRPEPCGEADAFSEYLDQMDQKKTILEAAKWNAKAQADANLSAESKVKVQARFEMRQADIRGSRAGWSQRSIIDNAASATEQGQ